MSSGCFGVPLIATGLQIPPSPMDFSRNGSEDHLDHNEDDRFNGGRASAIPLSINGLESVDALVPDNDPSSLALSSMTLQSSSHTFRDDDFDKAVEKVWDEMGNK